MVYQGASFGGGGGVVEMDDESAERMCVCGLWWIHTQNDPWDWYIYLQELSMFRVK